MTDESEEIKTLAQNQLACLIWPIRLPKDNASFLHEFINHIKIKFNEPSPNKYARELQEFTNLRNIALSVLSNDSLRDANSLKALKKYYCQLVAILNRFKDCDAVFSWKDSFGRANAEGNLEFEINNVMYNIAAIHNEFGSKNAKTTELTTKEACLHFNNALWWVSELRDNRTGLKPKEMGHDMLTFFHHVLRAQAQDCILLHSIRTSMKPDNIAKIAAQIVSDYDVACKLANSPLYTDPLKDIMGGTSLFVAWRATVEFKHKYYSAINYLLLGIACRDDSAKEIGIRIARLKQASQYVEKCKKSNLGDTLEPTTTKASCAALETLVTRKLDKAIRYNDNVYHSIIPNPETLPQPTSMLLATAVPFSVQSSMPEFKDLFASLVTIESVQVSSIYSQKKDDLARQINQLVEKQDEDLVRMMSTLNIDKKTIRLPPIEAPDGLIEICAELSMNPSVVDDVLTKLEEIDDKSEEIQKMFNSAETMIQRRPNKQYQEQLVNFRKTHEGALRTNQSLHKQLYPELQQKIQLMATTNNPLELLPKIDTTSSSGDEETIRKLERLLDKVDDLKRERVSLLNQLKYSLNEDDVIKHVVTASSDHELKSVFDKEIQKHNQYTEPLRANLKQQDELLDTIERLNAQYGQLKLNHRTHQAAFNERVESLKKFHSQFKTICDHVEAGMKFHNELLTVVKNWYSQIQASNDINDFLN